MEKDLSVKGGERGGEGGEKKKLKKKGKKKAPQSRRGGVGPSAGSADSRGGDVRGRGKVSPWKGSPRPDHHVRGLQGKLWFPSLY